MKQHRIFDGHLGCNRLYAKDALKLETWEENLMIHFEASHHKAGQKYLDLVLEDPRLINLKGISLKYEKKPTLRQIVAASKLMPNLQYAFFSGPRNWNHFTFFEAFPGIQRMYAEGVTYPFDPIRHIGLQYLGLMPERWGIRNVHALSQCIFPDLEILAFDLKNTTSESIPILADILAGVYFPRIDRVHFANCRFTNKLIAGIVERTDRTKARHLHLMNCPLNNKTASQLNEFLHGNDLTVYTDFHRIGNRTRKTLETDVGEKFVDDTEITPY